MGRSDKPVLAYRFADHLAYIDGFVEALGLDRLVLVGHDWGVATAVDWWHRHQDRGLGIAFLEGHLRPLADWAAFDEGGRALFQQLRTPAVGEQMVLEENFFIDALLPNALLSRLPANDFAEYRRPYPDPVSRRPLLQWAREIPIGGEPADVATRLATATAALATSRVPKLLLRGQPGVVVTDVTVEWCQDNLPQLSVVDVGGPAGHFLPEDRPAAVAEALATWVDEITA